LEDCSKTIKKTPTIKSSIVVITGASQGIGRASVYEFAKAGAKHIFILSRSDAKLKEIAADVNKQFGNNLVIPYAVDCSDGLQVETMAKEILEKYGTPNIIVNSAGAGRWRCLWEMSTQEIRDCSDAPFLAAAFTSRSFLPAMIQKNSGVIVNVQSPAAYTGFGGATAYLANRWALRGLSEGLRADVDGTNIKIKEAIFGETRSNYFENNPGSEERIPWIGRIAPAITPDYCAKKILVTIKSCDDVRSYPPLLSTTLCLARWFPTFMNYLVRKTGWNITKVKKVQ